MATKNKIKFGLGFKIKGLPSLSVHSVIMTLDRSNKGLSLDNTAWFEF